jgi:hypothetical protein
MDNRPLPRRDRVKLFRGEYAGVWERRLVERHGWPKEMAGPMSRFLTGEGTCPRWPALAASVDALFDDPGQLVRGRIVDP